MKDLITLVFWLVLTALLSIIGNWALGFAASFLVIPIVAYGNLKAIILGFVVGFISWAGTAYFLDKANEGQLSQMVASLLKLDAGSQIILMTGVLGGLGVSLAAWTASNIIRPIKTKS